MIAVQYEPVRVCAPGNGLESSLLSEEAKRFLAMLARTFASHREELRDEREARRREFARGRLPQFLPESAHIRGSEWKAAAAPADLLDRRVEIAGAADRQTIEAAMHSGANVYVADLADATAPAWAHVLASHANLRQAVKRAGESEERPPALMLRPRRWLEEERHLLVDGAPIAAALFDCGLYLFHNARALRNNGTAPYFCLPGVESRREARLWNDLFTAAEEHLRMAPGTVRATAGIESLPAAFEMDEIVWELREHCAGLRYAPWQYCASFATWFPERREFVLAERARLNADRPFLNAYSKLLVETCHRRGTHAIGSTAVRLGAREQVRREYLREVWAGHDGARVAHPELVAVVRDVFDTYMPFANQIGRARKRAGETDGGGLAAGTSGYAVGRPEFGDWAATSGSPPRGQSLAPETGRIGGEPPCVDTSIDAARTSACATGPLQHGVDLLDIGDAEVTEAGLGWTVETALECLSAWLGGIGSRICGDTVENAATIELCCGQLRQWTRHETKLETGRGITAEAVHKTMESHAVRLVERNTVRQLSLALGLLKDATTSADFEGTVLSRAYELLE